MPLSSAEELELEELELEELELEELELEFAQSQAVDPRFALQDLIIEQSKGPTEARQQKITAIRGKLGTPDTDRSVYGFDQIKKEDTLSNLVWFGLGVKPGVLKVGPGALCAVAQV